MTQVSRLVGAVAAAGAAISLGALAAWPIYRTPWLWAVAVAGLLLGAGLGWARARWRWSPPVLVAVWLAAFLVTLVPVAVPSAMDGGLPGLGRGFVDGVAAVALGWKQLLTLTLPVGTYQTVLVPAYLVFSLTGLLATTIALRPGRWASLAAIPLLAPVAFGTVFGSSAVSDPLRLGPVSLVAPRELGAWLLAGLLGAVWVAWTAGAERRAALRRGRAASGSPVARGRFARAGIAAGTLAATLVAGALLAPSLTPDRREVPRDRVDPEIVVRERPSPLAAYRNAKRDDALDRPLFEVSAEGRLPQRLRLAVLDVYDGVDFHVGADAGGRFSRFPSGDRIPDESRLTVEVAEGYSDIWAPSARLGDRPSFSGPRASELADAFYVNRETDAAIVVPDGGGLARGDAYTAVVSAADPGRLSERPASNAPLVDLEQTPELARWIEAQGLPASGEGVLELIQRLRDRGYLSHSLSAGEGQRLWLQRLSEEYGTVFEPSAGGHSVTRLEELFGQLNAQQRAAGENAGDAMLVAGVGDDEQFAAAAALVARAVGFESRVVVGVRLGDGVPGVPACDGECSGENVAAWVELRGEGGDWVPVDVTPQAEIRPTTPEEGEQLPEFPTVPEERDAHEVDPPLGLGDSDGDPQEPEEEPVAAWIWPVLRIAGLSLAALALLALPVVFLPLAKRARARGRRAEPQAELRALGAWDEMVDRARDAGVDVPEGGSRRDVALALGTRAAVWAAAETDRAVFSPGGITDADADLLWAAADADRTERAAGRTRGQRMREAYSLRSYGLRARGRRGRLGRLGRLGPGEGDGPGERSGAGRTVWRGAQK
ncbi:hypothetical protein JD276_00925 [Leucobacter sp. CSA1]|uniref:Transglutaminase-like domain-containing protein n=1 Tax=Leucobacter chromiisoli TaxID=2796471 RepID=A0A934Q311_9MICO|nr:transglutaminase domain-containing protein [Leucobacter chromiisoli]MBK0417600.1 hypothetical protein [Leucobacter chromiisoli]